MVDSRPSLICVCGQILKIAPFIHSQRAFSKNLDFFQVRPIFIAPTLIKYIYLNNKYE
jgi:hypothetical protein